MWPSISDFGAGELPALLYPSVTDRPKLAWRPDLVHHAGAPAVRRLRTRTAPAVFVVPMIVGLVTAQRAAPHVRMVDFLLLFASGVVFGVSLMGIIQALRARRRTSR